MVAGACRLMAESVVGAVGAQSEVFRVGLQEGGLPADFGASGGEAQGRAGQEEGAAQEDVVDDLPVAFVLVGAGYGFAQGVGCVVQAMGQEGVLAG